MVTRNIVLPGVRQMRSGQNRGACPAFITSPSKPDSRYIGGKSWISTTKLKQTKNHLGFVSFQLLKVNIVKHHWQCPIPGARVGKHIGRGTWAGKTQAGPRVEPFLQSWSAVLSGEYLIQNCSSMSHNYLSKKCQSSAIAEKK